MPTLLQTPEVPIKELWEWQTDIILSDDATEQRIELRAYPKRTFANKYMFDEASDIRRELALFLKFGEQFDVPLWQYQTRLKQVAAMAATTIFFVASRTDLREGGKAYVFDRDGGEIVTVDTIASDSATLLAGLSRAYGLRASVCPVSGLYSGNSAAIDRGNPDHAGTADLTLREIGFNIPFVHEWNEAELTMFGGLPVLETRPMGTEFDEGVDSGIEVTDYGSIVELRNSWNHAQLRFNRRYLCQRAITPTDWDLWRVFADYARGSCNPFFVPTYREDFPLVTPPALGGTTMTVEGSSYRTDYFPYAPFKQVAIFTSAGVHYATVSAAIASGANTAITFAPALPGSAGWNVDPAVSLLLKCRIADDRVSCDHFSLHTELELSLRTVDA